MRIGDYKCIQETVNRYLDKLQHCQRGDEKDAAAILKYVQNLVGYIWNKHTLNRMPYDDLVSVVVFKVFDRFKQYKRDARFDTWVYTITMNEYKMFIRNIWNRNRLSTDFVFDDDSKHQYGKVEPIYGDSDDMIIVRKILNECLEILKEENELYWDLAIHNAEKTPNHILSKKHKLNFSTLNRYRFNANKRLRELLMEKLELRNRGDLLDILEKIQ